MPKVKLRQRRIDDSNSNILYLNRALAEDASIIANFQSIDITTLPPKLRERVQNFLAERECEDYEQLDSDHEELLEPEESEVEESEVEESEVEELEPEELDYQQMEVESNIRDKIQVEVTVRGAIVRERMAINAIMSKYLKLEILLVLRR